MNKKLIIVFIFIFISLIIFFKFIITQKNNKSIGSLISLDAPKESIEIVVYQNEIWFEPFEDGYDNYKSVVIKKTNYPHLFKQGITNSSFIRAEIIKEDSNIYIKLSNNQPNHGAFSSTYSLIINPIKGEVIEHKKI